MGSLSFLLGVPWYRSLSAKMCFIRRCIVRPGGQLSRIRYCSSLRFNKAATMADKSAINPGRLVLNGIKRLPQTNYAVLHIEQWRDTRREQIGKLAPTLCSQRQLETSAKILNYAGASPNNRPLFPLNTPPRWSETIKMYKNEC